MEEGDDSGWRIEKIFDHTPKSRVAKKSFVLYLVKWKGSDNLWTWEWKSTVQHYEGAKLLSCYKLPIIIGVTKIARDNFRRI